jgi:hypothetical protein
MNGLFRFIAKLVGRRRPDPSDSPTPRTLHPRDSPTAEAFPPETPLPKPVTPEALSSSQPPAQAVVLLDLTEDEDIVDEPEDESDEPDPTLGRYEELQVEVLVAEEIDAQRAAAEAEGLSGPHKVFPHDPAGPGSLAETLARLEADGRVTSRVCDDPDSGFYVLYEPSKQA